MHILVALCFVLLRLNREKCHIDETLTHFDRFACHMHSLESTEDQLAAKLRRKGVPVCNSNNALSLSLSLSLSSLSLFALYSLAYFTQFLHLTLYPLFLLLIAASQPCSLAWTKRVSLALTCGRVPWNEHSTPSQI